MSETYNFTTTNIEKGVNPLDFLAPEMIVNIISNLPNLKSVLAFSLTSRRIHSILVHNESTIARNIAAKLLEDDDPNVVRLAFLACQAGLIKVPSVHCAQKFLSAFVNPTENPSRLYRFRTLASMPSLSMSVELLLDWTATYGML
ncbi:hypothetical protein F4781DRAFT_437650 [Annulohypoxylon bovei var. microspora]|nr:hypothetical protein F4781DRAFT_437650 [Annulohypoxylon bovei var. microspora]